MSQRPTPKPTPKPIPKKIPKTIPKGIPTPPPNSPYGPNTGFPGPRRDLPPYDMPGPIKTPHDFPPYDMPGLPVPIKNPNSPYGPDTGFPGPRIPQLPPSGGGQDFIDNRDPNKAYTMNMISYIDPATGEVTSRTNGIVPAPGSRFVRYYGPSPQGLGGEMSGYIHGYVPERGSGQLPPQGSQAPIYSIPSGEMFNSQDDAMQKAMYNDLMAQQFTAANANDMIQPTPVQPIPAQSKQPIPLIPKQANNQAMQNYSNILQQGVQNYASQMGNPNFGMPKPTQQKNISTSGYPSPKPFG
jgi:hypothetical protein